MIRNSAALRSRTDFSWLLERFAIMRCVGMEEVSANIPFDDPRTVNFFRQYGEWRLPVTIESTGPGEGRLGRLFRSHANLFADLSALSGYNAAAVLRGFIAITRDPEFRTGCSLARTPASLTPGTECLFSSISRVCSRRGKSVRGHSRR